MAVKQTTPNKGLLTRYVEAREKWIRKNCPQWLVKTLMMEPGGLVTPSGDGRYRWFTHLLTAVLVVLAGIMFIERYL